MPKGLSTWPPLWFWLGQVRHLRGKQSLRELVAQMPKNYASSLTGFVMVDQVKSIDYRSRQIKYVEQASSELLEEVLSILDSSLF